MTKSQNPSLLFMRSRIKSFSEKNGVKVSRTETQLESFCGLHPILIPVEVDSWIYQSQCGQRTEAYAGAWMVLRNRTAHKTPKNHEFTYSPARAGHRSRFLFHMGIEQSVWRILCPLRCQVFFHAVDIISHRKPTWWKASSRAQFCVGLWKLWC